MKVIVTGASGFIGQSLCSRLRADGHDVRGLSSKDADLTVFGSLENLGTQKYDMIFHLAAWTQAGDFCLRHPGEQWVINQKMNTNVLEWWQKEQPQAKLICMGTSCAYSPDAELVEKNYMIGEPIESLYTYAMTKRMLYAGVKALNKQYGLKYLCLVPSTVYGPGYHTDGRQMHFIFDLIRKILRGKEYGETVTLWGDGHQKRELVFLEDFIQSVVYLSMNHENDLVNIGAGEEFSIRHFARLICELVGYEAGAIHYDTSKYVGAKSKCLDVGHLHELYPTAPNTMLAVGLQKTIQWFKDTGAYGTAK
jgi:GDP-L-fucose synthase